jgi:ribosomal protein S18 acetylase RimI-like enzyme
VAIPDAEVFTRLERFYDAVPRDAAVVEEFGGLVLFIRTGAGWPFYARPRLGADDSPSVADILAVRARQRASGVPEAFEWVHETTPDLLATARDAGLTVLLAPLLVLDPALLPPSGPSVGETASTDPVPATGTPVPSGTTVRIARVDDSSFAMDVARQRAVAQVGFAASGTLVGTQGAAERDAAMLDIDVDEITAVRNRAMSGRVSIAVAERSPDGVVASGVLQRVDDVAEIAGIATLPVARRQGLGGAVTATLARHAIDSGVDLVFLAAGSEEIARIYLRIGFRRIGTACIAEPDMR